MKLIDNTAVKTSNNKGYTMHKIVGIVKNMLNTSNTFDEFNNAFRALEDNLEKTDFMVFFSTGDDFGYDEKHEWNWYFNVTNMARGNEKTYDITEEIDALRD